MAAARSDPIVRSLTLAPHLSEASRGRALIAAVASEAGFPEGRVFDITVACSEAIANAIEHAPIKGEVLVRTILHPDRLEVEIQGPGEFQAPDRLNKRETRGLGLPLMAKLSDHVALFSGPKGGTFVGLTFYLPGRNIAEEDAVPPSIRELLEENELTAAITRTAPVGLYVLDADLRLRWANRAYREFLEEPYRSQTLEGVFVGDAVPGSGEGGALDILRTVSRTGEPAFFPEYAHLGFARGATYWRWEILPLREERPDPPFDVLVVISEITEQVVQRRNVEALGREATDRAERLSRLIDSMTDEVWIADQEGRLTLTNPSASAEFGISGADGTPVEDFAAQFEVYRADMTPRPTEEAPPLRALAGEVIKDEEEIVRTPRTGELRTRLVSAAPIHGTDGIIIGSVSVVRDTTEHKRAEDALRESQAELSFSLDLSDVLRQLDDPVEIQATAARLLGERLGADRVFYGEIVVDDRAETLVIETDYHRQAITSLTGRFPFKEFSNTDYENYRAGRTVSSPNVFADERSESQREAYRAADTAAFVGVPLVKDRELVSVLGVLQREPRAWTAQEIRLAEQTADRTWHAVQRARAESALRSANEEMAATNEELASQAHQLTERQQALRESEERYRQLFTAESDAILVIDQESGRVLEANAAAQRLYGYSPNEFLQLTDLDLSAEPEQTQAIARAASPGDTLRTMQRLHRRKGGSIFPVAVAARVFELQGRLVRIAAVRDVTEAKKAEEELRRSEERVRSMLEASRDLIYRVDLETGRYDYISPSCEEVLGYTPDEMTALPASQTAAAMIHPDDLEVYRQAIARCEATGSAEAEWRQLTKSGEYRWLSISLAVARDEAGRARYRTGTARDITEPKRAEHEIRDLTQRLTYHMDNSPVAVIEWGPDMRLIRWSGQAEHIFGWTADEVLGKRIEDFRWVYDEDLAHVDQVSGELQTGADPKRFSLNRNYRKDGSVVWCEWYNSAFKDESGTLRSILSLVLDVTERKRAEEALRNSEERTRYMAQVARIGFVEWNAAEDTGYWSQEHHEILGYEPGSPLQWEQWLEGVHPEDRERVLANAARLLDRGRSEGHVRGHHDEYRFVRSDGNLIWIESDMSLDMVGDEPIIRGSVRDITERMQTHEALRESEERYRLLSEQNERLYRQQLDIAESLQLALLNIPSEIGPVRIGHLYRSATEAAQVGGDFYDAFEVRGGKVAILIGDVAGHGIEAARTATLVKDVVHAFVHESLRPHQVLRRTNALLVEKSLSGFVTAFLAVLDPAMGVLRFASAGHPETLLRRASGEIQVLGSGSSPLGVYPDATWKTGEVRLELGDLLLFYTDGVIEARRNGELFGQKRLEKLLNRKRVTVERLPHLVLDQVLAFSEGTLSDDVAVLALSLTQEAARPDGGSTQQTLLG
jgi:PAS domain S-box-containing protein